MATEHGRVGPLYLLDTNVLSELARPRPHPGTMAWLRDRPAGSLAVAAGVVTEIERGLALTSRQHPEKARALASWLDGVLGSDIVFLPTDAEVARLYGRMTADPALKSLWVPDPHAKRPSPGQDLSIAATAIVARATVATANVGDFRRIHERFPLPGLVDPSAGPPPQSDDRTSGHGPGQFQTTSQGHRGGTLRALPGHRPRRRTLPIPTGSRLPAIRPLTY